MAELTEAVGLTEAVEQAGTSETVDVTDTTEKDMASKKPVSEKTYFPVDRSMVALFCEKFTNNPIGNFVRRM